MADETKQTKCRRHASFSPDFRKNDQGFQFSLYQTFEELYPVPTQPRPHSHLRFSLLCAGLILVGMWALPIRGQGVGLVDTTFGSGGIAGVALQWSAQGTHTFSVQPDDKILIAGTEIHEKESRLVVLRLLKDGEPDISFGKLGKVTLDLDGLIKDIVVQEDGKILVGGYELYSSGAGQDFLLVRLNSDGSADESFGYYGRKHINFGGNDECQHILLQPDKKIVLIGRTHRAAWKDRDFALARLHPNGSFDRSFGDGGRVVYDMGSYDNCRDVVLQPDGYILVAGYSESDVFKRFTIFRLQPDGNPDILFGEEGKLFLDIGMEDAYIESIVLDPNGDIFIAGSAKMREGDFDLVIMKLNGYGNLDGDFGNKGLLGIDLGGTEYNSDIYLQSDGQLLVAGSANYKFALFRVNSLGQFDKSFGKDGKQILDMGGHSSDRSGTIALQSDGKILLSGVGESGLMLTRLSGNPSFSALRSILNFDWTPEGTEEYASFNLHEGFTIQVWIGTKDQKLQPRGTNSEVRVPGLSDTEYVHIAFGKSLKATLIWDREDNSYYFVNGKFTGSIMEAPPERATPGVHPRSRR